MSVFLTLKRRFQNAAIHKCKSVGTTGGSESKNIANSSTPHNASVSSDSMYFHRCIPTAIDKQYLVWSGQYKSKSEIPTALKKEVIERARSWGRIRLNLSFMVVGIVGCCLMVYFGKQAAKRGESVESKNLEWHRKLKEEHLLAEEAKKTKPS